MGVDVAVRVGVGDADARITAIPEDGTLSSEARLPPLASQALTEALNSSSKDSAKWNLCISTVAPLR